jgi:hypothetical protein
MRSVRECQFILERISYRLLQMHTASARPQRQEEILIITIMWMPQDLIIFITVDVYLQPALPNSSSASMHQLDDLLYEP